MNTQQVTVIKNNAAAARNLAFEKLNNAYRIHEVMPCEATNLTVGTYEMVVQAEKELNKAATLYSMATRLQVTEVEGTITETQAEAVVNSCKKEVEKLRLEIVVQGQQGNVAEVSAIKTYLRIAVNEYNKAVLVLKSVEDK